LVLSVLVYIFGPHNSPSILFHSAGTGSTFGKWLPGFLAGGVFVGLWALFTFETAGTLGEETIDAKRQAPRAILGALWLSVAAGAVFLLLIILSLPDVGKAMVSATPIQDAITGSLASWVTKLYLLTMVWVLFLATNTLFTAICRHIYGMARENRLPASAQLTRLTKTGEPWIAAIVVAVITSLPIIIVTHNLTVLVTGAIAAIYVPYVLVLAITLWARLKGWPHESAPFSLGRWGIPVNIAAVVCSAATLVDLVWPRAITNPVWKLDIRVFYWLVGIPLIIGVVYYFGWVHNRLAEPQTATTSDARLDNVPG
jgi:amino acid transporter